MTGAGKRDGDQSGTHAINYWWGMSAGVVEVIVSRSLPEGTDPVGGTAAQAPSAPVNSEPFAGVIVDQSGTVRLKEGDRFEPEEIIGMDWLVDNVVGQIPEFDQLIDAAAHGLPAGRTKEGRGKK